MSLTECPRCHHYSFEICDCQHFRYWFEENEIGDDEAAEDIYAGNYISAAEEASENYWQSEIHSGGNIDIWIKQGYNGKVVKFDVEAEVKVEYTAAEAK